MSKYFWLLAVVIITSALSHSETAQALGRKPLHSEEIDRLHTASELASGFHFRLTRILEVTTDLSACAPVRLQTAKFLSVVKTHPETAPEVFEKGCALVATDQKRGCVEHALEEALTEEDAQYAASILLKLQKKLGCE